MSETEEKGLNNRDQVKKDVVQNAKEEKARLAQVVLFNNIISSHLSLKRKRIVKK